MKKTILTAAGPHMMQLLEKYSLPSFEHFADRYDYSIEVVRYNQDSLQRKDSLAVAARWQKISLMTEALRKYDVVWWLDADVILQRFDEDPLIYLKPDSYQALVLHHVPAENRINPNTGVWLMRSTLKSFEFLERVQSIGLKSGRWADQGAVLRALGWECGDSRYWGARPPIDSSTLEGVVWLPTGWNQPYAENRSNPEAYVGRPLEANPHAVHFMAMTVDDRMVEMQSFVEKNPIVKKVSSYARL